MTTSHLAGPGVSGRLPRGSLSREGILAAALHVLDEEGAQGLNFNRLGKQLGASPTAVYRHFASRGEILVAIADELIGMSIKGYEPADDWVESLRDLAYRAWRTFEAHPAAATHTFFILTLGPNELVVVNDILEALHQAGFRGRDAVMQYHKYSDFVLSASGRHAAQLAQMQEAGSKTRLVWNQEYHPARPEDFPYVSAVRDELRTIDPFEVYVEQIEALLSAIAGQAPAPAA